ncbi:hypothetical protein LEP1GSC172_3260 [Leptospira noguchii]|uniref:Uncharacterized protein n=1 Tax=Leptospira noguchii TaxID=28182 RepID=M6VJN1_9LEPT|nr:hypothetical protein LEP1GSC172_3260 [Leptospira noguchii]
MIIRICIFLQFYCFEKISTRKKILKDFPISSIDSSGSQLLSQG